MVYNFKLYLVLAKADENLVEFIVFCAMPLNKKELAADLELFNLYGHQVAITQLTKDGIFGQETKTGILDQEIL